MRESERPREPESTSAEGRAPETDVTVGEGTSVDAILSLQQTAGNQAVARAVGARRRGPIQARGSTLNLPAFDLERHGEGEALDRSTQETLEDTVGQSLENVRIHEDGEAERIGAQALTQGSDIHFATGEYRPDSSEGFRVLAHEVAHVVQQREGRVSAAGGAVVSEPGLEHEAEELADRAQSDDPGSEGARAPKSDADVARSSSKAVQPVAPAAAAFLGLSAEAWGVASNVVGIVTAVGGAAAGVATTVAREENAVASLPLPQGYISEQDESKLQQIAQYEIINQYVDRYLAAHQDVARQLRGEPEPAPAAGSSATGRGRGGRGGGGDRGGAARGGRGGAGGQRGRGGGGAGTATAEEERPTGAPEASAIDEQVMTAVKNNVERELRAALEDNIQTMTQEFMWGEDDTRAEGTFGSTEGQEESVGVTGWLQYRNIQGVGMRRTLALSNDAKLAIGSLPDEGQEVKVRRFVGGSVGGRANWSAWDNLAVNFVPGEAQKTVAPGGAAKLIVRTSWYWDRFGPNSETFMQNEIVVGDDGVCRITATYERTP